MKKSNRIETPTKDVKPTGIIYCPYIPIEFKPEDRISILAYKLWEEEGRPEGRELENWFAAEKKYQHELDEFTKSSIQVQESFGTSFVTYDGHVH